MPKGARITVHALVHRMIEPIDNILPKRSIRPTTFTLHVAVKTLYFVIWLTMYLKNNERCSKSKHISYTLYRQKTICQDY